jgi:cell fate (sporulation/competence/biofilm development) regulator YlbF (YheA/YmcA/DUF963 family)
LRNKVPKRSQWLKKKQTKIQKKQLTSDERFAKKSQMLDEQIVMKEKMKKFFQQTNIKNGMK